jgi:hypothetical protein
MTTQNQSLLSGAEERNRSQELISGEESEAAMFD